MKGSRWQTDGIIGSEYGKLTVIAIAPNRDHWPSRGRFVFARCLCGVEKIYRLNSLRTGNTKSCGCIFNPFRKTHGMMKTPLFWVFYAMKGRCQNKNNKDYARYGGRGIRVCDRWQKFENFLADMGPTYRKGLTLERKNNDGNYEPSNCEWATRRHQARNSSKKLFIFNGEYASDAAKRLGLRPNGIACRIAAGWSIERAFTSKKDPRGGQFRKLA